MAQRAQSGTAKRKGTGMRQAGKSESTESKTRVITIRDARRTLPKIVDAVTTGESRGVVVGPRGKPDALVVSFERYQPLINRGDKRRKLALLIVEDLLGDAPQHIRMPAVDELSRLPMGDLVRLFKLESLPSGRQDLASIKAKMSHPEALDRLHQRIELAATISRAREAGLYEAAEDMASDTLAESDKRE